MKKENKANQVVPDILEPSADEIQQTQWTISDKYNVHLSKKKAARFARLTKELNWWLNLKNDSASVARITKEMTIECEEIYREKYNKEITKSEAIKCAKTLLESATEKEKQKIGDEMTAILKSDTKN